MFGYLSDIERALSVMDSLHRQVGSALGAATTAPATDRGGPRFFVKETPEGLVVSAAMPGLADKDIDVRVERRTLTVSGTRKIAVPEGYGALRRERRGTSFSRSLELPADVEVDKLSAELKDGVFTLRLPKAPQAQPRKIAVKVG